MLPTYAQNSSKIFYITPGMSGNGPRLNSISPSGLNDTVVATLPDSTYPTSMAWSDAANDFVISDGISQAYTITAYGTGYTKIFTGEASAEAWSPNGQVIAIEGKSGVYTINANGTDQRMVISADTCMTTDRSNISWDGNSKLIVGCNDGSNYSVVQSDAGVLTTILSGNGSTIDSLSASPNGSYIAYILTGAFGSGETGESVYTDSLVVANSTPTLIYQIGQVASYAILGAATSWLPDSSAFVFTGPNYENPAIHISSPSGDVRQIVDTESPGNPVLALSTNSGASEIASSPEPVGMTGTKTSLAFDDEFSGTALDTSKWTPNKGGTAGQLIPAANEVPDIFDPAQVSVSNGSLNLGAISQVRNINGVTYDYSSGAAWTGNGGFTVAPTATAPVTMEARIYIPAAPNGEMANWPTFWSSGNPWPQNGEIDVLEGLGGKASYHFHYQSGINSQGKPIEGSENGYLKTSYTGWHTYAVVWTTTTLTYYYDGAPVGSINSSVTDAPQFLVLSYEVGDHTAADPGAYGGPIVTPDTMQVDYVRVWN
jgi:hypothetical protein